VQVLERQNFDLRIQCIRPEIGSRNAEEWSSGLGNQSLDPKDIEGILTTLMCEDKNAARQSYLN
jgi:hypothetical protein